LRIPESQFTLDLTSPSGLQAQLRENIVMAILQRHLPPGARLPSSRRMATHLGVARITVALVYQDLVADGYLATRQRSGVFIAADPPGLLDATEQPARSGIDWSERIGRPFSELRAVHKPPDWRQYPYPFLYGQADDTLFPHNDWRDCARRALGRREFHQIASDMASRDDPQLVAHTLSHSLPGRGIGARHSELLITMGAQNALWLAVQVLTRNKPRLRVAIEEPCYPDLRETLKLTGAEVLPVPVDADGLNPDFLPGNVDLVCVTPSHQAPTGVTMPAERRAALIERARREDFLILEDDYDFEMSFLKPPSPALKSRDADGRVIYAGSYSKPLFPGLRLGYLVAPEPFVREARGLRALVMRHPPGTTQRTTAHFLALGHYNAHITRMQKAFRERRAVMADALASAGFKVAGASSYGGASFWLEAPAGTDTADLALRASDAGVLIEPGAVFFDSPGPCRFFRMAYSSIPAARIPEGIKRLAACL
jgi:GntR family transcriptional regulator/MocR family aminotransferase